MYYLRLFVVGILLSLVLEHVNIMREYLTCLYATEDKLCKLLLHHSDLPFA